MKTTLLPSLLLIAIIGILTSLIAGFVGYTAGTDIGTALAYDASFDVGYRDAFDRNKDDGFQQGYSDGLDQGIQQGTTQVDNNQIEAARNEGFEEGNNQGLEDGTIAGIKTVIATYLNNNKYKVQEELERANYVCNNSNICEITMFNDSATSEKGWNEFDLNSMTFTLNTQYTRDGIKMQQRVIIDYRNGEISAEWRPRSEQYTSPYLLYNWLKGGMLVNTTGVDNQEQLEFMLSWYNDVSQIAINAGIDWVLVANRG
jgi:hypothetical protein